MKVNHRAVPSLNFQQRL